MDPETQRCEAILLEHTRLFLVAHERAEEDEQRAQVGDLGFALAMLLGHWLDGALQWPPGAWIDDFLPTSWQVLAPGEVAMEAVLIWAEKVGYPEQWVEPAAGLVRVSPSGDRILGYWIRFGDRDRGLKHSRCPAQDPPLPEKWIFEFSKSAGRF